MLETTLPWEYGTLSNDRIGTLVVTPRAVMLALELDIEIVDCRPILER